RSKADVAELAGEIAVVVFGDVGVETGQPKALEQMGLSQIADIIIDPAAFVPARDRENIARQHREEEDADDDFGKLHDSVPGMRRLLLGSASRRRNGFTARSEWEAGRGRLRRSAAAFPRWYRPAARRRQRSRKPKSRGWARASGPAGIF